MKRIFTAVLLSLFACVALAQSGIYIKSHSGGVTIGAPVIGGTVNQVLYVDSSGNAAGSANLTFDGTNVSIASSGGISLTGSTTVARSSPGIANWVGTLGFFGTGGTLVATASSTLVNLSVPINILAGTATGATSAEIMTQTRNYSAGATDYEKHSYTLTATHASDNMVAYYGGAGGVTLVYNLTPLGAVTFGSSGAFGGSVTSTGDYRAGATNAFYWNGRATLYSPVDGHVQVVNNANNANGMLSLGVTALTLTAGAFGMPKMTASGTAPGATGCKLELVAGTNANTGKLVIACGTSGTATTIVDNIGGGLS